MAQDQANDQNNSQTTLGPDCRISGEMSLDGDATIRGQFSGTLQVGGMLNLTESSHVSGTVVTGALRLGGKAEADIVAEHGTELLAGAQLTGELYTSRLSVIEGAIFEGDVCVGPKAISAAADTIERARKAAPKPQTTTEAEVNTVPKSLEGVLQRRRNRGMVGNGNGNGNGHRD